MVIISKIPRPGDAPILTVNDVQLKIDKILIGKGTLYITRKTVSWQANNANEGVAIPWKEIGIHGVRDYIYILIDQKLQWHGVYDDEIRAALRNPQNSNRDEEQAATSISAVMGTGNDEDENTEFRLLHHNFNIVATTFQMMNNCQSDFLDSEETYPESEDSYSFESFSYRYDSDIADDGNEPIEDMDVW